MPHRPLIEPLESRQLLSITWVNRGTTDHFAVYGDNALTARAEVDAAIADWNHIFPKAKAKLTITAADLAKTGPATLGLTKSSKIQLDDNGATTGWYFDPALDDDAEHFKSVGGPDLAGFNGQGDLAGHTDFYTAALHEIAHALGYKNDKHPFAHRAGKKTKKDPAHTSDVYDLMYPTIPPDTRRAISLDDVDHVSKSKTGKAVNLPQRYFFTNASTDAPDITLSLDGVSDYSSFNVYRSTGDPTGRFDAVHPALVHTGGRERSWTDTDVSAGTTYHYWVSVSMTQGPFSLTVQPQNPTDGLSTRQPTSPGSNPGGSNPGGSVPDTSGNFPGTFTASTGQPLLALSIRMPIQQYGPYTIYRSTTDNGTPAASNATVLFSGQHAHDPGPDFVDTTAQPGVTYYYWATVYYEFASPAAGNVTSSAVAGSRTPAPDHPVSASVAGTALHLTWPTSDYATQYVVYRSATNPVPTDSESVAYPDTNSYDDPSLTPGVTYHYRIAAINTNIASWANSTVAYPGVTDVTPVFFPADPHVTATQDRPYVTLTFPSAGAAAVDHYDIYRATTDNGSPAASDATLSGTAPNFATHYIDTARDSQQLGHSYYYWIFAAYHDPANPDPASLAHTTTPAAALGIPIAPARSSNYPLGSVHASDGLPDETVSWDAVPGATGYNVYYADPAINPNAILARTTDTSITFVHGAAGDPAPNSFARYWVQADTGAPSLTFVGADSGYVPAADPSTSPASDGTYHDFVRLTLPTDWSVSNLDIYRSTTNTGLLETSHATLIASLSGPTLTNTYDDRTADEGQTYYYWFVTSSNYYNVTYSLAAPPDAGFRGP